MQNSRQSVACAPAWPLFTQPLINLAQLFLSENSAGQSIALGQDHRSVASLEDGHDSMPFNRKDF